MKEIVKVLLQEGIDEDTIHEVLDVIEGFNLSRVVDRAKEKGKVRKADWWTLHKKAMKVPSDNDMHTGEDGKLDTSNMTNKDLSKREEGRMSNDFRRVFTKGRDKGELYAKRDADEKAGYPQAIAKAVRRHEEKAEKQG